MTDTITLPRATVQQALEALERALETSMRQALKARIPECGEFAGIAQDVDWAATALRAALEQPEPEKVAWRFWVGDWQYVCDERMLHHLDKDVFFEPLYTMPPKQRKKSELSPMQEAAQMLRHRAAKQRKDNGND